MNNKLFFSLALLASSLYAKVVPDAMQMLVAQRHSGYQFDSSRSVSKGALEMIMKAGQMAPSSYNDQPWMFLVCDRATNPESYEKVMSALVEFNQGWAKNAPVLMVTIAHTNSHNNEFNRWAQYDTGAAAMSMMLQATSLGMMAHQMGGFDDKKIAKLFNLPEDCVPMAVMALGYEVKNETERAKKERKPLNDIFITGSTIKKK